MAYGDKPGVFGSLRELRPSGKVAAPMTLNMQGLEPAAPQMAENIDDNYLQKELEKTLSRLMAVDPNSPEGLKLRKKLLTIDERRGRRDVAGTARLTGPWTDGDYEDVQYDGADFASILKEAQDNMNQQGWRGGIEQVGNVPGAEPVDREFFRIMLGLEQ